MPAGIARKVANSSVFSLVDVSDFFVFFCLCRGKGESEAPRGGSVFIENPRSGGFAGGGGGEGPGGCLRRIG